MHKELTQSLKLNAFPTAKTSLYFWLFKQKSSSSKKSKHSKIQVL